MRITLDLSAKSMTDGAKKCAQQLECFTRAGISCITLAFYDGWIARGKDATWRAIERTGWYAALLLGMSLAILAQNVVGPAVGTWMAVHGY